MELDDQIATAARQYLDRLDAANACTLARTHRQEIVPMQTETYRSELAQADRDFLLEFTLKIHAQSDLQAVLDTTVTAVNQYLDSDRVAIYQLLPQQLGRVVASAGSPQYPLPQSNRLWHNCYRSNIASSYRQGVIQSISDIEQSDFSPSQIADFEQMQVRGFISVPLLMSNAADPVDLDGIPRVWGLLIVHQCDRIRQWQQREIALLEHLSEQIATAIAQCERIHKLEARVSYLTRVSSELLHPTVATTPHSTTLTALQAGELDDFAAIAARELRAPLRGISHLAAWLEEDLQPYLNTESVEQFALIQQRVARIDAMIEGLLQYATIGCNRGRSTSVDVSRLLGKTIASLAIDPAVKIEYAAEMPHLNTDRVALSLVLAYTIENAIAHHPTPDRIVVQIQAQIQGDLCLFRVIDNGAGITPEACQRIFEPFQSSDRHLNSTNTGLGLTIVKKTIERRGGKIWVESQIGSGSTFNFTWPCGETEQG